MKKPVRTISGVTPIGVVLKPYYCPGKCLYCPNTRVPKSYVEKSPAIMRASSLNYDAYKQVKTRISALEAIGHPTSKVEIIIIGGTFTAYPSRYQYNFVKKCYDALNEKISSCLEKAKKINEKAKHRCIGLDVETRPDFCGKKEILRLLNFGSTRCELGVQILDDEVYKKIRRGHNVENVRTATKLLKDAGFAVCYHLMLGLPGSSFENDIKCFEKVFSDDFCPDKIKIYPTQVVKGSRLARLFEEGKYIPYSDEELIELLIEVKKKVPKYCRIMRIMREFPFESIIAGTKKTDMRNIVKREMEKRGMKCSCIRCREIGFAKHAEKHAEKPKIKEIQYNASDGKEFFLSFIDSLDTIYGICRARICESWLDHLKNSLLIRELYVFGKEAEIGERNEKKQQHHGLGAALLSRAEEVAEKEGMKKVAILSGIGSREYYRKFGYKLFKGYMIKKIK